MRTMIAETVVSLGLLGVERALVVQALGGLPEARPGKLLRVALEAEGDAVIEAATARDGVAARIDVDIPQNAGPARKHRCSGTGRRSRPFRSLGQDR